MYPLVYSKRDGDFLCDLSQYHNKDYWIVICIAYMDFPPVLIFSNVAQELHNNVEKTGRFP